MKFLILALCVCAASAASLGYKPWQPVQPAQQVVQAFAQAVGSTPEAAYKAAVQPTVQKVQAAKSVAYTAPAAVANAAAYANKEASAAIVRSENDVAADRYDFAYETENGIAAQSSGVLKNVGDSQSIVSQGFYQYPDSEGRLIQVSYVADENGYQPKSDILPVGPAIPDYIIRALEYIRAHPSKETN